MLAHTLVDANLCYADELLQQVAWSCAGHIPCTANFTASKEALYRLHNLVLCCAMS